MWMWNTFDTLKTIYQRVVLPQAILLRSIRAFEQYLLSVNDQLDFKQYHNMIQFFVKKKPWSFKLELCYLFEVFQLRNWKRKNLTNPEPNSKNPKSFQGTCSENLAHQNDTHSLPPLHSSSLIHSLLRNPSNPGRSVLLARAGVRSRDVAPVVSRPLSDAFTCGKQVAVFLFVAHSWFRFRFHLLIWPQKHFRFSPSPTGYDRRLAYFGRRKRIFFLFRLILIYRMFGGGRRLLGFRGRSLLWGY